MTINMRKLEITSYIAVIVASLLLSGTLLKSWITPPSTRTDTNHLQRAEGQTLSIPGVNWSRSDRSMVLAISSHCPFCINSTSFYHDLAQAKMNAHSPTQLIAVLPEAIETSASFLNSHQVKVDQVASSSLADLHVEGTPTILVVDGRGKIVKAWYGKLAPDAEKQVMKTLLN